MMKMMIDFLGIWIIRCNEAIFWLGEIFFEFHYDYAYRTFRECISTQQDNKHCHFSVFFVTPKKDFSDTENVNQSPFRDFDSAT